MRLIDTQHHLFQLPPQNVMILAPPRPSAQPLTLSPLKLSPPRSLTVHSSDGSSARWEQTSSGWRKLPV